MTDGGMHGRVTEIEGDLFAAEFNGPLVANFNRSLLPDVQVGDLIDVSGATLQRVDTGVWTQAELDGARSRARERALALRAEIEDIGRTWGAP